MAEVAIQEPSDVERLYAYAAWMLGDRDEALRALRTALSEPMPAGARFKDRLPAVRAVVLMRSSMNRRMSSADKIHRLDEVLRKGTSISMPMHHPSLKGDARNLPVLLNGFMQSCLIAGVQTLSPAVREVFVMLVVLDLPEEDVRQLLDLAESTLSSYKTKMMQGIEGYLEPRCSHLDRGNACRCERRLLLALEKGFVALPKHEQPSSDYPYGVYWNVRRLFEVLPPLRLSAETLASLPG